MRRFMTVLTLLFSAVHAQAQGLKDLSNADAVAGLKEALVQGAGKAVGKLGVTDGFFGNPEVKIPLPDSVQRAERIMRTLGMGKQADEVILRMNRAAEAAVPEARELLINAVKQMSVADAKNILTGSDDAATQYFRAKTAEPMTEKFLPIVQKAMADVQLVQQYNKFAEAGARYGLVKKDQANLEQYVTQKALDGVYLMMAKEEQAIRENPMQQASNLLKKVFGSLGR
ncbi:MAG TPA: DUF4197 domain-containing protein [Methylophilaceae bacterium]|jgi:hypothetical protein